MNETHVNISKGARVDITKSNPGLNEIVVGLGWNPRKTPGVDFDLDAMAFLKGGDGKCHDDKDWVFYNNLTHPSGAVSLSKDNRTGAGDGDDEQIMIALDKVPESVAAIDIVINIYLAEERKQNFGQVDAAYCRVVDKRNGTEILKYDLTEDYSTETVVVVGQLYRNNGEWKFAAKGDGKSGISALRSEYGV